MRSAGGIGTKKKAVIERRRRNLGASIHTFQKRMDRLDQALTEARAVLAAYTMAYQAMPEGKYKVRMHVDIKRLEYRLARLEKLALTCNTHHLLAKQLLYNRLDAQIAAIDSYLDLVETKKKTVDQAFLRVTYTPHRPQFIRPAAVRPTSRFEKRVYNAIAQKVTGQLTPGGGYSDGNHGLLTNFMRR